MRNTRYQQFWIWVEEIFRALLIQTYSCLQEKVLLVKLTSTRESLVEGSEAVRGAALGLTLAPVQKNGMEEENCHHKSENGNAVSSSLAFIGLV